MWVILAIAMIKLEHDNDIQQRDKTHPETIPINCDREQIYAHVLCCIAFWYGFATVDFVHKRIILRVFHWYLLLMYGPNCKLPVVLCNYPNTWEATLKNTSKYIPLVTYYETATKQSQKQPCAYFVGHVVSSTTCRVLGKETVSMSHYYQCSCNLYSSNLCYK